MVLFVICIEQLKILLAENCSDFDLQIATHVPTCFVRNNTPSYYFDIKFKWFRTIPKFISLVFFLFIYLFFEVKIRVSMA